MNSNNTRILTKEEIETYKKPVWIEEVAERIFKNDEYRTYGGWYLPFRKKDDEYFYFGTSYKNTVCHKIRTYGIKWRCWTDEPTKAQKEEKKMTF